MSPLVKYAARRHRERPLASALLLLSLTLVAFTIGAVGAVGFGLANLFDSGSPQRVIVFSNGATYDLFSKLAVEDIGKVAVVPGVVRSSPENAFIFDSYMPDGTLETVRMVGLDEPGFAMHRVKVVEGRMPAPGALEFMVGKILLDRNPNLAVGKTVKADRYPFTCVGVFEGDPMFESGLLTTRGALAVDRGKPWLSVIAAEAASDGEAAGLVERLNGLRTLEIDAYTERDHYRVRIKEYRDLYLFLYVILVMVVAGGILAAAATLTVMQNRRLGDMGVLRAVGFPRRSLRRMLLVEIQLMTLVAAVVGGGAAWVAMRGFVGHLGFGYAPISFTAEVTPVILLGIVVAMALIGLVSSVLPLRRLRRLEVAAVLRI